MAQKCWDYLLKIEYPYIALIFKPIAQPALLDRSQSAYIIVPD